jgi:cytochrome-b5 reductase
LFVALGLVLHWILNEPSADDAKPSVERKPENFKIAEDGGVLKTMPQDEDGNIDLKLSKKIKVSEDTFIFRFSFDEDKTLGLPIGKHVIFSAMIKDELVCRKYTPISMVKQKGYVDFLIKVYFANVVPRFPDGGIMSQYVNNMKIGDVMKMEGPKGRLKY